MGYKDDLKELREKIDKVDKSLIPLFLERMNISREVAKLKCENNLSVKDASREQDIVDSALEKSDEGLKPETALFMRTMIALSREYQNKLIFTKEKPLLPEPREPKQDNVVCAYQGVKGAWSEQAAATLFPESERISVDYFEDVFQSVKNGKADYGVVPIENSKTGAIGETYDLLRKYGCYIVGRVWVDIHQNLLGVKGSSISDVREVTSHPEGLKQCRRFLEDKAWDQTACRNTAVAAKTVAEKGEKRLAAIGSKLAAERYGLDVLQADIMDAADNRTSFVVIALEPEYDKESDLISITFSTQHRSGALCEALLPLMADNINLMRIESRPAEADKYRFFAEVQGNIMDEKVSLALRQVAAASEYFEVLGAYKLSV